MTESEQLGLIFLAYSAAFLGVLNPLFWLPLVGGTLP